MDNGSSEVPSFLKTSRADLFLMVAVLSVAFAGSIWLARNRVHPSFQSPKACIYHANRFLTEVDLGKDRVFAILDGKMRIEVKSRKIRVLESDCPQHVCMQTGWIRNAGQSIVCIPNHVLIEIKPATKPAVDAVAY